MNNRRSGDQKIDAIHKAVAHNTKRIDELTDTIEPIKAVWDDVAAVGRFGRWVKIVVSWVVVVGGSGLALWHYLTDIKIPKI